MIKILKNGFLDGLMLATTIKKRYMETILVIGATGMLGEPVAKRLQGNFKIRLFVRDIEKSKKIFGNDYDYIIGDIFNNDSLEKAMNNCYGVHINLSGEIEQAGTEIIVEMAKRKNIQRITYISGTSVCKDTIWFPLEKRKYYAEHAIISSGIPYTIFCPTWFMESLPKYVKGNKAFVFGKQPNLYHFIAVDDYAKMVLTAYQKDEAKNKRFIVHGKEGILFKQALEMYVRERNPSIKSVSVMPYLMAKLVAVIANKREMKEVAALMQFFEKVRELGNPQETYKILGIPEISLEKWIKKQK
ncbi:MAG: hypothetical protein A2X08_10005 [Bacteroidetes bacterium GWA2_32_17]|nr:MAG: hypothetical protein A2X08_10005 [Bacteroidetes bacterium GWA2_32_17]